MKPIQLRTTATVYEIYKTYEPITTCGLFLDLDSNRQKKTYDIPETTGNLNNDYFMVLRSWQLLLVVIMVFLLKEALQIYLLKHAQI